MTKAQWEVLEPYLRSLREHSFFIERHALNIKQAAERMPFIPDFETKAHDLMFQAEKQLVEALRMLTEAKRQYEEKPVIAAPVYLQAAE